MPTNNDLGKKFSIVITGEWPGAGQSTTAAALAKTLGFPRVYAGRLFRAFANAWQVEKEQMDWKAFEKKVANRELKLESYNFSENQFNEQHLHEFQFKIKESSDPAFWDKIIDLHSLQALSKPGVVVEAKVGVLLDKLGILPKQKRKHRIFKFLLTCPPEISAHRVIKRKIANGELKPMDKDSENYNQLVRQTTTDTINRQLRDWERYEKIYGIYRSDIYRPGTIRVFTADKTQEEVVETLLSIIEDKLTHRNEEKRKTTRGQQRGQ